MQNRGLKQLVLATALIPSLLIALGLGFYLNQSRLQDIDQLLHERGRATALQLANAARPSLRSGDSAGLRELAALALEEPGVNAVAIYDRGRQLRGHAGMLLRDVPRPQFTERDSVAEFSETLRFTHPVRAVDAFTATLAENQTGDDGPLGWISVEYSRQPYLIRTYQSLFVGGLIIALALFAAAAIAVFASRRLDSAASQLRQGIQRIAGGEYMTPIHLDENSTLQGLAQDLNKMAANIQTASIELRRNLEQTNRDLRESLETVEVQNIELDLARREALEASRIKSEFLANTSHELRTPLSGIIGFTKLLLKSGLDARQREYLETIRYSAENLLSIINDILDLSKIEAGKLILDNVPFNLREVIEDTLTIVAPSANEKKLDLVLLYDPEVPAELVGDPLRLRQVLTNLISNGIKFTQRGHIAVHVSLTGSIAARVPLKVSISDTGIGIDQSHQQQLFRAFAQADASTSREYGGTGLGLAISKRLVEQMGGEIGLESQLGAGSTFWFALRLQAQQNPLRQRQFEQLAGRRMLLCDPHPLSRRALQQLLESWQISVIPCEDVAELAAAPSCDGWLLSTGGDAPPLPAAGTPVWLLQAGAPTETAPHTYTTLPKPIGHVQLYDALCDVFCQRPVAASRPAQVPPRPLQILAVDDNATNLKLVAVLLEELGAHATLATSGRQALALCEQRRFNLILLDIQMPELNGAEVAQLIRQGDTVNRGTRVVALTAHLLPAEHRQLLDNGFDRCLTKPITEDQLQELLELCGADNDAGNAQPVNIELCLQRARQKPALAREFLQELLSSLAPARARLQQHLAEEDNTALLNETHKLHGASCYSGTPRLQRGGHDLEEQLKQNGTRAAIVAGTGNLIAAIDELLDWANEHDLDALFDLASPKPVAGALLP